MILLRFLTAGESHGQALTAIIEGFPAGVSLDIDYINRQLAKRQGGYGRGKRMVIEKDQVQFLAGLRDGKTLGSPITMLIWNKDWENWQEIMRGEAGADVDKQKITRPRPGHADLAGTIKYGYTDLRNTLERASARETAIRVAVGALAENLLKLFNISIFAHVVSIGGIKAQVDYNNLREELYETPLYCTDEKATKKMIQLIDGAREEGDSLGGVVEVVVDNLPPGLGSHVHWDRKLDGCLAGAIMSIQGFKGVEIGMGFAGAELRGSEVHDPIGYEQGRGFYHYTNKAGGLEGGMTNGEKIIIRGAMKPIPTLYKPLESVDFFTKEKYLASVERSDVCAVPAASIVAQAAVAWEIARIFLEKFAGDHQAEIQENYQRYLNYLAKL